MFTYSKYRNDNLPDFNILFDVFFNVIHEHLTKFETFLHGCLVRRVAFICPYLNFLFKSVKFQFLFIIHEALSILADN